MHNAVMLEISAFQPLGTAFDKAHISRHVTSDGDFLYVRSVFEVLIIFGNRL